MHSDLKNILFIDLETVRQSPDYQSVDERLKKQWSRKASFLNKEEDRTDEELYLEKAGIYAEFGKVIVIGMAFFHEQNGTLQLRTRTLADDDEAKILREFKHLVTKMGKQLRLCGHNGREFDFPYLSRRMLVNGISLPDILNTSGKKPWEVNHIDTMDMWKFGDWKHYTSLDLLAAIFDIESSKSDMDGSMVSSTYYQEDNLKKIADYCIRDVIVTAQLFAKLKSVDIGSVEIMAG